MTEAMTEVWAVLKGQNAFAGFLLVLSVPAQSSVLLLTLFRAYSTDNNPSSLIVGILVFGIITTILASFALQSQRDWLREIGDGN